MLQHKPDQIEAESKVGKTTIIPTNQDLRRQGVIHLFVHKELPINVHGTCLF